MVVALNTTTVTLERFGFTPTETKVYESLLRLGPSTGYAVAKDVRLARANAYQALDGLVREGVARKSATIPGRYSALRPDRVVLLLERRFTRNLRALEESLRTLGARASDDSAGAGDGIADAAALLSQAAGCAASATAELLVVGGPSANGLSGALAAARLRGASVRALWLGDPAPADVVTRPVDPPALVAYWGGEPLVLVADRQRAVCGVFTGDRGAAGIATASSGIVPFLRHLLRRELAAGASAHG